MMYCKDCFFRDEHKYCTNEHVVERDCQPETNNSLVYSYNEDGAHLAEDFFGCVHFKEKEE